MSDDEYEVPLQDQRIFGAGIKRKRVHFVPSSTTSTPGPSSHAAGSVADRYLSVVLSRPRTAVTKTTTTSTAAERHDATIAICFVCNTRLGAQSPDARPHEATLWHQLSSPHSQPPHALDRRRLGLRVLQAHGWDADAAGMRAPVKLAGAKTEKGDRRGLGLVVPEEYCGDQRRKNRAVENLDAGKVSRLAVREKYRDERLRDLFYRSEDVERYLGGGA